MTPTQARLRGLKSKLTRQKNMQTEATARGLHEMASGFNQSIRETEWKISQLQLQQ